MDELNICNEELWCYLVMPEVCHNVDIGEYQTYGIRVVSPDYTQTIHDISVCEEVVAEMARLFTKYQLSPVHFEDAVDDMLCEI